MNQDAGHSKYQLNKAFDTSLPTFNEITTIVNRMKSFGSQCPHEHISVIILKLCPMLRTVIHQIISHCWTLNIFPTNPKQAFTIFIYKKDCCDDPSNLRPIITQSVLGKVYSSLIRNGSYDFLTENQYIKSRIQKVFWQDISGTIDHTGPALYRKLFSKKKTKSSLNFLI